MVEYKSIETQTQSLVFNIIKSNISGNVKVLDGRPMNLMRSVGFPYVLVHSPERGKEVKVTNRIRLIPIKLIIEIFAKDKEGIIRSLTGEVLGILESNQPTTRASKNYKYITSSTKLNIDYVKKSTIFKMTCVIKYEVSSVDSC